MDKRLLIALFLCFLLLWMHTLIFPPPEQPPRETPEAGSGEAVIDQNEFGTEETGSGGGTSVTSDTIEATDEHEPATAVDSKFEASAVDLQEDVVVQTDTFQAVFTNEGAALKSLKFKRFFIHPDVQHDEIARNDPANWLEILGEVKKGTHSFLLKDAGGRRDDGEERGVGGGYGLDSKLWEYRITGVESAAPTLTFILKTADGLIFRKIFAFHPAAYHVDLSIEIENRVPDRKEHMNLRLEGIAGIFHFNTSSWLMGPTALLYTSSRANPNSEPEFIDKSAGDVKGDPYSFSLTKDEDLHFAGLMTNYFTLVVDPQEGRLLKQVTFSALEDSRVFDESVESFRQKYSADPQASKLDAFHKDAVTNVKADFLLKVRLPKPGTIARQNLMFFAGPKDSELMKEERYRRFFPIIEDSYGFFAAINRGLLWILRNFYALFHNWGVAIICLTVVIKLLLFPLSRVQQVSMHKYSQKMSVLKPKLDELKKKFKNNKKKFNEEQMKLMKEHGATPPLLGCLLLILQIPIFIGLFQALKNSFELRHSPFMLWINDLSQPDAMPLPFTLPIIGDTLNVVPILMTVAFYYQQKSMPQPTDPQAQQTQKIMKFMPIIFGVMFYGYMSGLSLYWMTSNLLTIVEYKLVRKKFPVGGVEASTKPK